MHLRILLYLGHIWVEPGTERNIDLLERPMSHPVGSIADAVSVVKSSAVL